MVILRSWAGAPLNPGLQGQSPGVQGQPIARATTLKAKSPRALLQRTVLTSKARKGVYRPVNSLNTSLYSGHGTPAGCSFPHYEDTPLPNQPRSRVPEFGALPGGRTDLASSQQGRLVAEARAAGPNAHPGPQLGPCSHDSSTMWGPGSTRMTTARKNAVRKLAMSTQWWQDGLEPRKIDVSVGKIYTLLPRQEGQVLPLHSRLWRKLQHLPVPQLQLQLLFPEHHRAVLP